MAAQFSLPTVPVKHRDFLNHVQSHPDTPIEQLLEPYHEYDTVLRKIFAQEPANPVLQDNHLNIVPLYDEAGSADVTIRARDLVSEPKHLKEKYIMPLKDDQRRPNGSPAIVSTLKEFQTNFNLFSEASLVDLDWDNIVAAGSAVVTSLLPVPEEYNDSKRGLRQFYHEKFAPASDVDLFLYGLTEEQAIEKIKQIETKIRDSILAETTIIRTKNAITIASQYPTRHVQIVLRIYKSVAEILTGFDVDCSCAAYDGRQVYVAPRALAAYMTQTNRIDLSRRSPSYESRLSKYSHRGFEVFWPQLDRSKIDPTIFERNFSRTVGLARLLVLEKLPHPFDRDSYLDKRRLERGRPAKNPWIGRARVLKGNIKNDWDDEVPDWFDEEEVSNYHTFTIPYGEKFHAKKIEKLLYTKDLLLNAEWNKPDDREVNLHRHPAFFGNVEDVMHDCCGYCPKPVTPEEKEVAEEEAKIYVSGDISFIKDDPGRQAIGSFNPITETDWTEMAYVGNTERLCQAIVDHDLEIVKDWLAREDADPNRRDYTGRTPLHLASMTSTPEIVQCLVDHGARLIARLADGKTALHLAAARGSVKIVRILLTKSEENEAEEARKEESEKENRKAQEGVGQHDDGDEDDADLLSNPSSDTDHDSRSYATGSFVKVKKGEEDKTAGDNNSEDGNDLEPDIYDINVLAWDSHASPLHFAILNGHVDVVEELVSSFGADVLLPIKLLQFYNNSPRAAILTLVLALRLPLEKAKPMTEKLLQLGASPAQADLKKNTPLHYLAASPAYTEILDIALQHDEPAIKRAINHLASSSGHWRPTVISALTTAIHAKNVIGVLKLLELGADPAIEFTDYVKSQSAESGWYFPRTTEQNEQNFQRFVTQPVALAVEKELPLAALDLIVRGADPDTLTPKGNIVRYDEHSRRRIKGTTVLDLAREKLKALRKYKGEQVHLTRPLPLCEDDDFYLAEFGVGTYKMLHAERQLRQAREQYETAKRACDEAAANAKNRQGVDEKKATIKALIADFEKLETALMERGAKSFKDLYPEIEEPAVGTMQRPEASKQDPPKAFKVSFTFRVPDLTDVKRDGYFRLFEAAWCGNISTIKALTLAMWGPNNDQPPLQIAVTDGLQLSPFSIAIFRGHRAAAKVILEIVRAQHKPQEEKRQKRIARIESDDDDNDDEGGLLPIYSEIIDDQFTIENIGEIATKVECRISPSEVLHWSCPAHLFVKGEFANGIIPRNLLQYAISLDDVDLLLFLLDLGKDVAVLDAQNQAPALPKIEQSDFEQAIELGRLRCLEEMIKRTAVGLPLDELVEKSGVVITEKPKYYQGLSVHGKKRADWAAAGRGDVVQRPVTMHPPLLMSALRGSLSSVEWFLSTAPGRYYMEFTDAHKHDKRVQKLALATQGIERCIVDWLHLRENLVLHCAVLSKESDESKRLVKYLVDNVPDFLEVKSDDGHTPLALAFSRHRAEFAKILIDAGANQAVRDSNGNNVLHLLLCDIKNNACTTTDNLQQLLDLIDPLLVPSFLTERSSQEPGSLTPLARWIHSVNRWGGGYYNHHANCDGHLEGEDKVAILRLILDFAKSTGQKHLELLDGAGNTPMHDIIRYQLPQSLELMLDHRPDLLHRENATGCTPFELAVDAWINEATSDTPSIPGDGQHNHLTVWQQNNTITIPPECFVRGRGDEVGEKKSKRTIICELCRKKSASMPELKRKLVTLYEANEVAKRLASKQNAGCTSRRRTRRRRWDDDEGENDGADEVSQWYGLR